MTQQNARELAKQGDPNVIANVLNRSLQPKGITAIVTRSEGYLHIILESATVPNQKALVNFIQQGLEKLELETIHTVNIYGQETDADVHAWEDEIQLAPNLPHFSIEDQTVLPDDELYGGHRQEEEEPAEVKLGDEGYIMDEMDPDDYDPRLMDDSEMSNQSFDDDESFSEDSQSFTNKSFATDDGYEDDEDEGDYDEDENAQEYEDDDDDQVAQSGKKLPLVLIILLVLLIPIGVLAGLHFSGVFPLPFLSSSEPESLESESPAPESPAAESPAPESPAPSPVAESPAPSPAAESPAPSPAASPVTDPWREAVSKATNAANLTQSARTKAEWETVAKEWEAAIEYMKQVPESHPNYATAQERAVGYQTNLDYATRAAANAPN